MKQKVTGSGWGGFLCLILGIFKVSFDVLVRGVGELKIMLIFGQQQKIKKNFKSFKNI